MKLSNEHVDSDSGRSPSDDEKNLGAKQGGLESLGNGELPPDPDAHLSPEERAAIVRSSHGESPRLSFLFPSHHG